MSDIGRKSFTDKAAEKLTPDSQKSTFQQGKEALTGTADKFAAEITPSNDKSATQEFGDKASNLAGGEEPKSYADTAKEYFGDAYNKVSETLVGTGKEVDSKTHTGSGSDKL